MGKWIKYKPGTYKKVHYDIKLHHGWVFYGAYPNAGMFHCGEYGQFDESLVAEVRESKLNDWNMPIKIGIK